MFFLILLAIAVPSYICGSINGAIIASMSVYRKDIRAYGSGNPGLTNFYRVFGKSGALLVIIVDALKTVGPVLFGGWLFNHFFGAQMPDMRLFGREVAGLFVIMGHCFPVFYGFNGGKGVMAAGTILFFIDWRIALATWGTFIIISALTRYVSLGSILGSAAFPVSQVIFGIGGAKELVAAIVCAALLIVRHEKNIVRLARGEESKFSFHRKKKNPGD